MDHQQATDLIHNLEANDIIIALRDHCGASYLDELPHSPHDRATLHAAAELGMVRRTGRDFYHLPGADPRTVTARQFRGYVTCISAAPLYGYPVRRQPRTVHLAVRRHHGVRPSHIRPMDAVRIHREPCLTPSSIAGVPCVPPPELLARALRCPDVADIDALAMVDSALHQGHVTVEDVRDLLRGPCSAAARELLAQGESASRSIIETIVRHDLRQAGFTVAAGVVIEGIGELDNLVEGLIDLETDGAEFHRTPEQVARDHWRDQQLIARGILPLRLTYDDVMRGPEHVVRLVRDALSGIRALADRLEAGLQTSPTFAVAASMAPLPPPVALGAHHADALSAPPP